MPSFSEVELFINTKLTQLCACFDKQKHKYVQKLSKTLEQTSVLCYNIFKDTQI